MVITASMITAIKYKQNDIFVKSSTPDSECVV